MGQLKKEAMNALDHEFEDDMMEARKEARRVGGSGGTMIFASTLIVRAIERLRNAVEARGNPLEPSDGERLGGDE